MPIDLETARTTVRRTGGRWSRMDVVLYHLGVGAGHPVTDARELRWVLGGDDLPVLPTFALVAAGGTWEGGGVVVPGVDVDMHAVLHVGQELVLHAPCRPEGEAVQELSVPAVYDKGSAALLVVQGDTAFADGSPWFTARSEIFVRGEGGFGGERGPSGRPVAPEDPPATVVDVTTPENLALVYRLSGDTNPLHADPAFAAAAGFERPILHGLCTLAIAAKAIVEHRLGGDPRRVRRVATRFAGVFVPGETLRVRMWEREGEVGFDALAVERGEAPVLAGGAVGHAGPW